MSELLEDLFTVSVVSVVVPYAPAAPGKEAPAIEVSSKEKSDMKLSNSKLN